MQHGVYTVLQVSGSKDLIQSQLLHVLGYLKFVSEVLQSFTHLYLCYYLSSNPSYQSVKT